MALGIKVGRGQGEPEACGGVRPRNVRPQVLLAHTPAGGHLRCEGAARAPLRTGATATVVYRLAHQTHQRWTQLRRDLRGRLGVPKPLFVLPFRGYGTPARAVVKARVLEDRHVRPREQQRTLLRAAIASYKRYNTHEVPGARVQVTWGDKSWEGVTDEEGFLDLWVPPPASARPGWHEVRLHLPDAAGNPGSDGVAQVLLSGQRSEYGVISDVDDTVIETGVTNPLKRAWALFLTDHRVRMPFEGVGAFYAALQAGRDPGVLNPIFYVSSSPWNLYQHLDEYLALHDIPAGPLLLRDWGLTAQGFAPGGGHGHKLDKIRAVMDTLQPLPFLLIGDSGQEDPEHYATIVREYPGRVRCIYIRSVASRKGREASLARIAADVRANGSELLVVKDSVSAARHAAAQGWIRWGEIPDVQRAQREDAAAGGVLDTLERRP
jgi:phosphatidate phosphatase APP1